MRPEIVLSRDIVFSLQIIGILIVNWTWYTNKLCQYSYISVKYDETFHWKNTADLVNKLYKNLSTIKGEIKYFKRFSIHTINVIYILINDPRGRFYSCSFYKVVENFVKINKTFILFWPLFYLPGQWLIIPPAEPLLSLLLAFWF